VCTEASSIFQLPRYPQSSQSCSKAHLCQSTQLGALALLFRLWGPKLPFLTLQHSFILSCLKAMLEKCHLLVLVEISCTFHFEYNLGERFCRALLDMTHSLALNLIKIHITGEPASSGHLEGLHHLQNSFVPTCKRQWCSFSCRSQA